MHWGLYHVLLRLYLSYFRGYLQLRLAIVKFLFTFIFIQLKHKESETYFFQDFQSLFQNISSSEHLCKISWLSCKRTEQRYHVHCTEAQPPWPWSGLAPPPHCRCSPWRNFEHGRPLQLHTPQCCQEATHQTAFIPDAKFAHWLISYFNMMVMNTLLRDLLHLHRVVYNTNIKPT